MIRIETHQTESHLTFRIAGKLCGASVRVLEDCWKAAHLSSPALEEPVDLSDVSSIDKAGWRLLRHMHRDGVRFSAKIWQVIRFSMNSREKMNSLAKKKSADGYFV